MQDIYLAVIMSLTTIGEDTSTFPISVGLHQGSTLSSYLFILIMDGLTRHSGWGAWCMKFADDIVLIDETESGLN